MLSCRNPAKPAMRTNGSRMAMKVRCFSAKVMIPFMRMRAGAWRPSPGLRGAIDEQAAARHDFLTRFETFQHLDHAVVAAAGADLPKSQSVVSLHHPDTSRLALPNNRLLGHGKCVGRGARNDAEVGKHLRLEFAVGVRDRRANRDTVSYRIHCGSD